MAISVATIQKAILIATQRQHSPQTYTRNIEHAVALRAAIRQLQLEKLIQGRLILFGKGDHGFLDFRQGRHRLSALVEAVATIHLTRSFSFKPAILGKRETSANRVSQIFLFLQTHQGMLMGGLPSGLPPFAPRKQRSPPTNSAAMEQKFDTNPQAEIRLEGRKVTRSDVTNDWGLRLQWEIKRDEKVIATPAARADASYEHADATPGKYEIVLQMWKYVDYKKDASGEFVNSKFVDISNKVSYTI